MSKRGAERDINDRNWDQEEEPEEAGVFSQATPDAMKSRQVIKAKRRNLAAEGGSTSFTGLSSFSFKPTQTSTPFNFNVKSVTNGKAVESLKKLDEVPTKSAVSASNKESVSVSSESNTKQISEDDKKQEQYLADLKNLNESVLSWIKQHVEKNAFCILTPIFSDYEKHLKEIEKNRPDSTKKGDNATTAGQKLNGAPASNDDLFSKFKPASGSWTCDTCLVSNKSGASKCAACETPKPGAKSAPTNNDDLFAKFKPAAGNWTCDTCMVSNKPKASKCAACEMPKPGAKSTPTNNDDLFAKFKPAAGNWTCDTCVVSNKPKASKCAACEMPKPGSKSDSKADGGFGSNLQFKTSSSNSLSGFAFNSNALSSSTQKTSGFTFGTGKYSTGNNGSSFGEKPKTDSKGFSFGNAKTTSDSTGVSFGAEKTKTEKISGFVFGTNKSVDDKNSSSSNETNTEKKGFSFGVGQSSTEKGGFSFGNGKASTEAKGFSFGTQNIADGKGFSLGAQKPLASDKGFSFGTDKPATEKSGFSFGLPKPTQEASGFGFGLQKSSTEPAGFSFGTGKTTDTSGFSFAVGSKGATDNKPDAGEEEYEPPKPESTEVEEEGSLYSVKCKLFYQNEGDWKEKGIGFLHLKMLDSKVQMVVRADTALGTIILNIILSKAIPLKRQGKNNISMICVPNPLIKPKDDPKKPVPMLIRVKTGEEADKLLEKMNELRDQS